MDSIRNYHNTVNLYFNERGENFTLKVPHYNKWIAIIKFLRRRGFEIKENPSYKEHYECLSKYHKIGFKKDVACLMEICHSSISVEFGNTQNLWTGIAQSFWSDPTDNRFTQLTYLESTAVKLEIKKLIDFCKKFDMVLQEEDNDMSSEQQIINKLKSNTHIHGDVNSLNDIKLSIESGKGKHNSGRNSDDKNGKKIICGDTKYFYDYYNNRLSCGTVWHNINSMWWVLFGNEMRNISAFDLFDFDKSLPKRKPADNHKLERVLTQYEKKKDYKRCIQIQKHIERVSISALQY